MHKKHCKILPEQFEENINELFKAEDKDKTAILETIIKELKKYYLQTMHK